jgi:hypothetical protein
VRRAGPVLTELLAVAVSAGCAGNGADEPGRAADAFEAAVRSGDADATCALLTDSAVDELERSSGQPCVQSVLDEVQPAGARLEVARFGTMAQARFRGDVLFLAEGPDGWRVLAAACGPARGDRPRDCGIAGG